RTPGRSIGVTHERLQVVVGDPCDPGFLKQTLRGQDAVISALGGRRPTKAATSVYYLSAHAIVEAAKETGLNRVLVTSTALLFREQPFWGRLLRLVVPNVVRSATRMEEILQSSGLNWTVARPGFLSDHSQEAFWQRKDGPPKQGTSVSRRALANFLINALENPDTHYGAYGVSSAANPAAPA
ncbi:MAG: SDR family oxidoreductase, partial [Paracoccaceae bacterium]|nr:SDR family oxidoreductase [Paracoccaceae bacterium]